MSIFGRYAGCIIIDTYYDELVTPEDLQAGCEAIRAESLEEYIENITSKGGTCEVIRPPVAAGDYVLP